MTDAALTTNYAGVFDGKLAYGRRPAIVVIDFTNAYTTPGSALYAEPVCDAVRATVPLLAQARRIGVPIIYTRVLYHPSGRDGGIFVRKVSVLRSMVAGEVLSEIDPLVAPGPDDVVLIKQYASAFFGTSLASMLGAMGIDTLLITGCSTSGCVRATAVDAMQHGFLPVVVRDCVGDRHPAPHEANLFDIQSKYGEVASLADVETYLAGLPQPASTEAE